MKLERDDLLLVGGAISVALGIGLFVVQGWVAGEQDHHDILRVNIRENRQRVLELELEEAHEEEERHRACMKLYVVMLDLYGKTDLRCMAPGEGVE